MACFLILLKLNVHLPQKKTSIQNNKNKAKFKFEGKSARSKKWFVLEYKRTKKFKTIERDYYNRLLQPYITG